MMFTVRKLLFTLCFNRDEFEGIVDAATVYQPAPNYKNILMIIVGYDDDLRYLIRQS